MKLQEYKQGLESNTEYLAAARELKPILDLADKILRLRLERGWSQTELARRAGTKQANISRIEAGLGNPTFQFIQKLANAFKVDWSVQFKTLQSHSYDAQYVMGEFYELADCYFIALESSGSGGPIGDMVTSHSDQYFKQPAGKEYTP